MNDLVCRSVAMAALLLALSTPTAVADEPDVEHGGALYERYCAGCHGIDGRGGAHTFMPHVGNLTRRDYVEHLPDERLFQVIMEGGQSVGLSSYMPAWKETLNAQDVHDIIAHIRRLARY